MILLEGGNVFKDKKGEPLTQRIDRDNVVPTVQWLERLTGLSLTDNMLGTTGRKATSGDIDLGVDETKIDKQTLINQLLAKQAVSYTHLRAHETDSYLVCRLLLEKRRVSLEFEGVGW